MTPTDGHHRQDIINEHIVWAYGTDDNNREVIIIGITGTGLDYLRKAPGFTLTVQPPKGLKFTDVAQVIIFHGKDKNDIKQTLRLTGMIVSEAH